MLTLYGVSIISISAENARHLVATLIADGGPDAITAAELISRGVDRELHAVDLSPAERDAILSVLEDRRSALWSCAASSRDQAPRSLEDRSHTPFQILLQTGS